MELSAAVLDAWSTDEVRASVAGSVVLLDECFIELAHPVGTSKLLEMGAWAVKELETTIRHGFGVGTDLSPILHPPSLVFFTAALDQPELYVKVMERCECELRATLFHAHSVDSRDTATLEELLSAQFRNPPPVRIQRFDVGFSLGVGSTFLVPGYVVIYDRVMLSLYHSMVLAGAHTHSPMILQPEAAHVTLDGLPQG